MYSSDSHNHALCIFCQATSVPLYQPTLYIGSEMITANLAKVCNIGATGGSDDELAEAFINRIRDMQQQFDIPKKLAALQRKDIPQIATAALKEARFTYAVPRYMDQATCEQLVEQMLME
jgi:alcohol dehydrogenase class IV